jgi:hypothetical protein
MWKHCTTYNQVSSDCTTFRKLDLFLSSGERGEDTYSVWFLRMIHQFFFVLVSEMAGPLENDRLFQRFLVYMQNRLGK